MEELYKTQKKYSPPIGTSPREKLHDVLHAKIMDQKLRMMQHLKVDQPLLKESMHFLNLRNFMTD
jgi:hypothetical protein